jgi:hypothetical protein
LITFLARISATIITAWRCCCILSWVCFGDRLLVAITIAPDVVVVRPVSDVRDREIAGAPLYLISWCSNIKLNSNTRGELCLFGFRCLFDRCVVRELSAAIRDQPPPGPKIHRSLARITPAHESYEIPRPPSNVIKNILMGKFLDPKVDQLRTGIVPE